MVETPEEAKRRRLRQIAETAGSLAPSKMAYAVGPTRSLRDEWRAGGWRRLKVVVWCVSLLVPPALLVLGGPRLIAMYMLFLGIVLLGLGAGTAIWAIRRRRD